MRFLIFLAVVGALLFLCAPLVYDESVWHAWRHLEVQYVHSSWAKAGTLVALAVVYKTLTMCAEACAAILSADHQRFSTEVTAQSHKTTAQSQLASYARDEAPAPRRVLEEQEA